MAAKLPEEEGEGIFAEINITPLTDIFLVLLIIFMVTSSILADVGASSGLKVDLPKGAANELAAREESMVVGISADGELMVEGKKLTTEQLAALFAQAQSRNPETQVIIQADKESFHGSVVDVMELARKAGLHRLGVATRSAQ